MAGTNNSKRTKKGSGQMVVAIIATVVAAVIIFGGGTYLFTRFFTASFHTFDEHNTMQLTPSEYKSSIDVDGSIRATDTTSVSPEVDGTVSKVEVKEGDKVEQGDTLFVMKNKALVKAEEDAKEAYEKAEASQEKVQGTYNKATKVVEDAQDKLDDARKAAEKAAKKLQEAEDAAADAEDGEDEDADEDLEEESTEVEDVDGEGVEFDSSTYDAAIETAKESQEHAREALDEAKAETTAAYTAYQSAAKQVELLTVKAPEAGTIADLQVEKGTTSASINTKGYALRIIDLETLMGVVEIPEGSISSVAVGQDCVVTAGEGTDAIQINATVYKVADTPTKKSQKEETGPKYSVQLTLDDISSKLKYGMSIKANIELRDFGTVYYVPTSAVSENANGAFVEIVYNDKTTKEHGVTVLDTTDDGQAIIQSNTLNKDTTIRTDLS